MQSSENTGNISSIQIASEAYCIEPAKSFLRAFALRKSLPEAEREHLLKVIEKLLTTIIDLNTHSVFNNGINLNIFAHDGKFGVEIVNKGIPLNPKNPKNAWLADLSEQVSFFRWENNGRDGQKIIIELDDNFTRVTEEKPLPEVEVSPEEIEIRPLREHEEYELTKLFCSVYSYNYINEDVYYPERFRKMIDNGDLISRVAALKSGRLVGHVGLTRWQKKPAIYEAGLGLIDPSIKSRGLFSQLFKETMSIVDKTPMAFCVYDVVTNHVFSQNQINRYGSSEMSISIGCQVSETQANLKKLGIGENPQDMDRYSILMAIRPRTDHPFGQEVTLPVNIGEMTEFLLEPLGLRWVPAPRFYPLSSNGSYEKTLIPIQKSVIFHMDNPGYNALRKIIDEWRYLMRVGYRHASVDIPLDQPGVGQTYDTLSKNGFFIAGFVPYRSQNTFGFRFQSLGPTQVAFDKIQIATESGQKLLESIRNDYERNRFL